jgi:hypothetical protein
MLKTSMEYDKDTLPEKITHIAHPDSSCFTARWLCCNQRALVDESGMIITQMGEAQ